MNRVAAHGLMALLEPVLPADVSYEVGPESIRLFCEGGWLADQGYSFLPGHFGAAELHHLVDSVQVHVIHCLHGYWPYVAGERAEFVIAETARGWSVSLESALGRRELGVLPRRSG